MSTGKDKKMSRQCTRYWWGVLYEENMIENWKVEIDDLLQLPYAYAVHTPENDPKSDFNKNHVHLIICWNNTTTYKNAFSVFDKLSAEGRKALNKIESIVDIENAYNYLIHDTDGCRKKGKTLLPLEIRVEGNNFDIHHYKQISTKDKIEIVKNIDRIIKEHKIYSCSMLSTYIDQECDDTYYEIFIEKSGHFERICKGVYLDMQRSISIPALVDPEKREADLKTFLQKSNNNLSESIL